MDKNQRRVGCEKGLLDIELAERKVIHHGYKKIGNDIGQLRKEKGLTQQKLADKLGLTNKAISKWETGEGLPDIGIFPSLAEILGASTDALLNGEPLQKNEPDPALVKDGNSFFTRSYWANNKLLLHKVIGICALFFGIFGVLATCFIWKRERDAIVFFLGFCIEGMSILLYYVSYLFLKPQENGAIQNVEYARAFAEKYRAFLRVALWVWLVVPFLALDYGLCHRIPIPFPVQMIQLHLIAFGTYLTTGALVSFYMKKRGITAVK